MSVSMHSVGSGVSGDEEDKDEDEELAHDDDDEQDVDEINHTQLPKEVVRAHSPSRRVRGAVVWSVISMEHIGRRRSFHEGESPFTFGA